MFLFLILLMPWFDLGSENCATFRSYVDLRISHFSKKSRLGAPVFTPFGQHNLCCCHSRVSPPILTVLVAATEQVTCDSGLVAYISVRILFKIYLLYSVMQTLKVTWLRGVICVCFPIQFKNSIQNVFIAIQKTWLHELYTWSLHIHIKIWYHT